MLLIHLKFNLLISAVGNPANRHSSKDQPTNAGLDHRLTLRPKHAALPARWRSGYAEDCKSLHAGSIPARASTHPVLEWQRTLSTREQQLSEIGQHGAPPVGGARGMATLSRSLPRKTRANVQLPAFGGASLWSFSIADQFHICPNSSSTSIAMMVSPFPGVKVTSPR